MIAGTIKGNKQAFKKKIKSSQKQNDLTNNFESHTCLPTNPETIVPFY